MSTFKKYKYTIVSILPLILVWGLPYGFLLHLRSNVILPVIALLLAVGGCAFGLKGMNRLETKIIGPIILILNVLLVVLSFFLIIFFFMY